ncbi:MAG TPA: aldehyde dehydrogenase family protein [Acetobacteraceae bacterium]|jgi:acyl-CoA reductase-like NAD-dependent aldehyde dehydrogenase|nr:aldehyde dehydrogenase family protein [Acetobacteraceae bacterium]
MPTRVDVFLASARAAQIGWAGMPLSQRLAILGRTRRTMAHDPESLIGTLADHRPIADTIAAELIPLADAIWFLETAAPRLLRRRRLRRGRPLWLAGVSAEVRREPLGVVLILAPANFPLMLPGIQLVQALAAGNAVSVKPAAGCAGPMLALQDKLRLAGLPENVMHVLDESVETGTQAVSAGYDKIVLTGSATTGAAVLAHAAPALTPATMELSGSDPMFVLPSADIALVADCIAYALRLNAGATCIATRRVFVPRLLAPVLEAELRTRAANLPTERLPERVRTALAEAEAAGARVCREGGAAIVVHPAGPVRTELRVLRDDLFAPIVSLIPVENIEDALAADRACPYALGATVFGDPAEARSLIPRLRAGSVVVNDVIVPTADPRLPFGGRKRSGFGVTRGAEGLLEMTALKSVSIRRGRFRPHLRPPAPGAASAMRAMLRLLHGSTRERVGALSALVRLALKQHGGS